MSLVLSPTRELAIQTAKEAMGLVRAATRGVESGSVVNGGPLNGVMVTVSGCTI